MQKPEKIWYVCDPQRATECKKGGCVHNPESVYPVCARTSHIEWAALDAEGHPILDQGPQFPERIKNLE